MAMTIVRDDLWLCDECTIAAVNGDLTGLDYGRDEAAAAERAAKIEAGLAVLGPHLVPDFDGESGNGCQEFSRHGCDCCGCPFAGRSHRFAVLGEAEGAA